MTLVNSHTDVENLTMTFTTEFPADVERVWQVWEDPRQLERWWGPPTVPATFERFEFTPGGEARYYMTTPGGAKPRGWWKFIAMDAPNRLELVDGFADDNGDPLDVEDVAAVVATLEPFDGGTRMTVVNTFRSTEQLEAMVEMGMVEGLTEALGQIDAILAETAVSR